MHVLSTTWALMGYLGLISTNSSDSCYAIDSPSSTSQAIRRDPRHTHNTFIDPRVCSQPFAPARCVRTLDDRERKRILVTGGAGFVGSHLVDDLMLEGHKVTVLDNFYTGRKRNIEHWLGHDNFILKEANVIDDHQDAKYDQIYHLASPASPKHYLQNPIATIETVTLGSMRMLELARKSSARVVLASTSEVYGDPLQHPQSEHYWGNTNPVGPRSCYDESKRLSESLAVAYRDQHNVSIGIARIFNTYGPRMQVNDGRVVSNFISQLIRNKPLTVYGTGEQTRSFQYITDLISGLKQIMGSNVMTPINLGNPNEVSITSLAATIKKSLSNSTSELIFSDLPTDDPKRRRPDIRKATRLLNWQPKVALTDGLAQTIDYFVQELEE